MSLQAINQLLDEIERTPFGDLPPAGRIIGHYGAVPFDYDRDLDVATFTNKALMCLRLASKACLRNRAVQDLLTDEILLFLYGLDPGAAIPPEIRNDAPGDILLVTLKSLRLAGNAEKSLLTTRSTITANVSSLVSAFEKWRQTTAPELVILTVGGVKSSLKVSSAIKVRLAAERLTGRGFTAAWLISELIIACVTTDAQSILTQLVQVYQAEAIAWLTLTKRIKDSPQLFMYGFYSGIPADVSSRKYEHLAAVAYRVLSLSTMAGFRGSFKMVKFPASLMVLIDKLKTAVSDVEPPQPDEARYKSLLMGRQLFVDTRVGPREKISAGEYRLAGGFESRGSTALGTPPPARGGAVP